MNDLERTSPDPKLDAAAGGVGAVVGLLSPLYDSIESSMTALVPLVFSLLVYSIRYSIAHFSKRKQVTASTRQRKRIADLTLENERLKETIRKMEARDGN